MSHAVLDRGPVLKQSSGAWYFRHAGETYGPYDCDALRDVIVAARIHGRLELRNETDREWHEISSVANLLNQLVAGSLSGIEPTSSPGLSKPVPQLRQSREPETPVRRVSSPAAKPHPFRRRLRTTFIRSLSRKDFAFVVALLLAVLVVNVGVVGSFSLSRSSERQYSRELLSIWDELREVRRQGASDSEWAAFQARADERLRPIVKELEKSADVNDPAQQHLLWASRDYLPKMLQDARQTQSNSEQIFERHMEESRRLLAGR